MTRPQEKDYTSHVAYTRALEEYCSQAEAEETAAQVALNIAHEQYEALKAELYELKHCQCGYDDVCEFARERDALKAELAALQNQKPVAYLAWRDGNPYWSEDCICQDAVWPADGDDDRTSMPVYLAAGAKEKTE